MFSYLYCIRYNTISMFCTARWLLSNVKIPCYQIYYLKCYVTIKIKIIMQMHYILSHSPEIRTQFLKRGRGFNSHFMCFLLFHFVSLRSGILESAPSVRPSVRPSVSLCVRESVRPGSDLRNCSMDFLDTWHDERPICPIDARYFKILKNLKMANLCQFLC